jgi:hypothetical protein
MTRPRRKESEPDGRPIDMKVDGKSFICREKYVSVVAVDSVRSEPGWYRRYKACGPFGLCFV